MLKKVLFVTLVSFCLLFSVMARKCFAEPANVDRPTVSIMTWDEKAKEGSDPAELRLFQVGKKIPDLTVYYTISGTAKNGFDYMPVRHSIVMRDRTATIRIGPMDDSLLEGDETVKVTLVANPQYAIEPNNASKTVVIQDNELPDIQFSQPSSSGEESISQPIINVVLSKTVSGNVKVDYAVSGILAKSDEDYNLASGTLVIPAGSKEKTIPLTIINDNEAEDDETVIVELANGAGANIGLNEKHFYTIINDDGAVSRSVIHDKIYGIILGTRAGSSLGAIVEGVVELDEMEKIYGIFDDFIPYHHYNDEWAHPAGGTEDGVERQKLMCTAIIEKQDRITADDLMKIWVRDCELENMYHMTQPYDRFLMSYAKWGVPADEFPRTKYGTPYDLGEHIHLTARVFHALPCINAGDPDGVIEDMKDIGRLYYEDKNDDAFAWGAVYNAALALAMLPGATVNSVIQDALKYATPEMKAEIEYGLAIAEKYSNPMDRRLRADLNSMYADPSSPYYANNRIEKYRQSSIYENVTCAFTIFKATKGNVEQAVIIATNRGRDTDCTAASAAGLAGAFSGTTTIPKKWIDTLEEGIKNNPYTNSHLTNKATADALYRALQNKLRKMKEHVRKMEKQYGSNLPEKDAKKKQYVEMMQNLGVI